MKNCSVSIPRITSVSSRLSSSKKLSTAAVATLFCLLAVALPGVASAYDVGADFSTASNPNGVWSYGWSTTLGAAFNLDTSNTTSAYGQSGLGGWFSSQTAEGNPDALHNSTASPITIGSTTYQPGQLTLNPNDKNASEYSVVRWTAPSSGSFSIAATFSGASSIGDSVDVHILRNGVSIFDSIVFPNPTSYSAAQNLTAGDTIDFAVGFGSNGNDHEDTTTLAATIVPEPGTSGLVGAGLGCLFVLGFLKRK